MKLSIVANLNESKSDQTQITGRLNSLCDFLKPLGYDGIELSLLEPEKINIPNILEILDSYQMEIPALGTGSTYIRYGYSLGHKDLDMREKAIQRIRHYIDFASKTNSKVIIGLIRGRYSHLSSPKKEKLNIISSLKICSRYAELNDVILIFEPINRFEIDSYNTISSSIELLTEIKSDNLKLLVDTFHTYLEEDPGYIWDYLNDIIPYVAHIHIADSTRRAPGSGHFDFKTFLNTFKDGGYKEYISLETIMKPSFEEVAKESVSFLRYIL